MQLNSNPHGDSGSVGGTWPDRCTIILEDNSEISIKIQQIYINIY